MTIYCRNCGVQVAEENIDKAQRLVKCGSCNSIFSIQGLFPEQPMSRPKPEIPLPEGIKVVHDEEGFKIIRDWTKVYGILLGAFAGFWGFAAVRGIQSISVLTPGNIFTIVLTLLPALIAGYCAAAFFRNKTTITVGHTNIKLTQAPLPMPYPGNKSFKLCSIKQLYIRERISYSSKSRTKNYFYDLHLIDGGNRHLKILSSLRSKEQALYIEQEIEQYLGIQDVDIEGTVRG